MSDSVEQIFADVAMMVPANKQDSDPFESEQYARFVESMAKYCRCQSPYPCPCDGVLACGLCDDMGNEPDFTKDDLDWSEEDE